MNKPCLTVPVPLPLPARKKIPFAWVFLALLLMLCVARAEGPDEDYLTIYGVIDQADALNTSGKTSQAHAKYIEAQRTLAQFQRNNPGWNTKTVSYRMNYLAEKVTATSDNPVVAESTAAVKREAALVAKSPVKLLDAGSEPRKILRLHPVAGDKQSVSMTMKMAMTMSAAGNAMPAMNLPAMIMGMEVEVKDVSATGEITYTMVFNDVSMATDTNSMPGVADAMKSAFATMRGMSGTGKMSDHGIIKSMEMKLPDGADPQMAQAMDQMKDSFHNSSTALPEEAVGAGAKWEYKTKMKSQGMILDQSITYELVSIEGDTLTLHTTVAQAAANQKIENPATPGLKVDLNKMTGQGTGGNTLDLGHLMPASGTLDEETEINMGMNIGQQKQAMNMKMNIKITLEAK